MCGCAVFTQVSHSVCVFYAGVAEAQRWEEFGANRRTDCSGSGRGKNKMATCGSC